MFGLVECSNPEGVIPMKRSANFMDNSPVSPIRVSHLIRSPFY